MNKNELAERLYALPDGIVIKGRKSLLPPALLMAAGVASFIVNGLPPAAAEYGDAKSALVLFGGVIFAGGTVSLLVRLFGGSGVPLYGETGSPDPGGAPLRQISGFGRGRFSDAPRLDTAARHRQSDAASVRPVVYRTADDAFVACQAFEYVELEERPLTELHVVRHRSEA